MGKRIKQKYSMRLNDLADGFTVKLEAYHYCKLGALLFIPFVIFLLFSFSNSRPPLHIFLFSVALLVCFGYAAAITLFNSVVLTVNKNTLSVRNSPIPRLYTTGLIKEFSIPAGQVLQVYCKQFVKRRRHWTGVGPGKPFITSYTLVVKTKTLGHRNILVRYENPTQLLLLKEKIDAFYNLDEKPPVVIYRDGESLYSNESEKKH